MVRHPSMGLAHVYGRSHSGLSDRAGVVLSISNIKPEEVSLQQPTHWETVPGGSVSFSDTLRTDVDGSVHLALRPGTECGQVTTAIRPIEDLVPPSGDPPCPKLSKAASVVADSSLIPNGSCPYRSGWLPPPLGRGFYSHF